MPGKPILLQEYRIKMFTMYRLGLKENIVTLLNILDSFHLTPDTSGNELSVQEPFLREWFLESFANSGWPMGVLRRKKNPVCSINFRAQKSGLTSISLELQGSLKDSELPYTLGAELAMAFEVAYGIVHPCFRDRVDFNMPGAVELMHLRTYGLLPPAARNWYGTHILSLLGNTMDSAGGVQEKTIWGAVRFDLLPQPWESGYTQLNRRQHEVFAALSPSRVFGDYSHPVKWKPGEGWKPIPE